MPHRGVKKLERIFFRKLIKSFRARLRPIERAVPDREGSRNPLVFQRNSNSIERLPPSVHRQTIDGCQAICREFFDPGIISTCGTDDVAVVLQDIVPRRVET